MNVILSTRWAPPWIRLWLAGVVVAGCTLSGLRARCDEVDNALLEVLLLAVGLQLASAVGSFVMIVVAVVRHDFRRAGVEALICLGMLLVIPMALLAQVSSLPQCSEQSGG